MPNKNNQEAKVHKKLFKQKYVKQKTAKRQRFIKSFFNENM